MAKVAAAKPHKYSVLISKIPAPKQNTAAVTDFFRTLYPNTFERFDELV